MKRVFVERAKNVRVAIAGALEQFDRGRFGGFSGAFDSGLCVVHFGVLGFQGRVRTARAILLLQLPMNPGQSRF